MNLTATIRGTTYRFGSVKEVLAKANPPKSGDDLAGVSARDPVERVAARAVLSELTLAEHRSTLVAGLSGASSRSAGSGHVPAAARACQPLAS